jgi:LytR cell envelope-related transcriptional attenuator
MGRHSSARQWHYYKSVVVYFLPWGLVAAIAVTAVWAGVGALGQKELSTRSPGVKKDESPDSNKVALASKKTPKQARPTSPPSPTTSPAQPSPSPTPSATKSSSPIKQAGAKTDLITRGITVQILNGTAAAAADDVMANRLTELGFDVVAVESSSVTYPRTTVLWSSEASRRAAEALGRRFGWKVEPKPANLSASVAIHVVVGADEI